MPSMYASPTIPRTTVKITLNNEEIQNLTSVRVGAGIQIRTAGLLAKDMM